MAALDASCPRQLLVLAKELHLLADELLRKEFARDPEIFAKIDKTKRTSEEALLGEKKRVRGEPALTAIIDKIEKLKNDAARRVAMIDEIQTEKMVKAQVETGKAAVVIDENQTEKMDKAPLAAVVIDENQTEKMDKAPLAAVVIDENQTEKMDKAPVEALDDEKNLVEAEEEVVSAIEKILMEKCAESDPLAAVNGKHRLSDEYVGFILAMPRENPDEVIPIYERCSTLAELRGEEWLEKQKRKYKERAARSRRMHDEFVQFQNWVLKQWLQKGYVEVDEEYFTNADELEEYGRELWEKLIEKRDTPITFADGDDTVYVPYDPVEQARVLLLE